MNDTDKQRFDEYAPWEEQVRELEAERDSLRADLATAASVAADLRARNEELVAALEKMTPAPGFPACTEKCLAQVFSYDEEQSCSCGFDEIRFYADQARAALAKNRGTR